MRYHEIAKQPDPAGQVRADQPGKPRKLSAGNLSPTLVEEPINGLFHDLMIALGGRIMNSSAAGVRGPLSRQFL
jgi:hypothetical protein